MKKLFEPSTLGTLTLKNRLIRSATWEGLAEENGDLNDTLYDLYRALSEGGVSAIITGYAFVMAEEQPNPKMFGIYTDAFIPSYRKLTDIVHNNDCKIFMQLVYGGSFTGHNLGERTIWGPSAVTNKITGVTPKAMTTADIQSLKNAFGDAAARAMKSGFDGVQIHAGHGYMLNHFLSPYFNQRDDDYGGSSENRARIITELFDTIKASTAPDYPVLIKLNCSDFMGDKGLVFDECKALCKTLAEKGITAVEISGGPVFTPPKPEKDPTIDVTLTAKDSYFRDYAKVIADEIDVPVILVGGNRSVSTMTSILNDSDIAYFSMSRPLLSEPDLINKWKDDASTKPRCTSCLKCFTPDGNICIQNREKE